MKGSGRPAEVRKTAAVFLYRGHHDLGIRCESVLIEQDFPIAPIMEISEFYQDAGGLPAGAPS